jgi:hypothetical protein
MFERKAIPVGAGVLFVCDMAAIILRSGEL